MTTGEPDPEADLHLAELDRALASFSDYMDAHPELRGPSDTAGSVALAKADHLASCAASVDALAAAGRLPSRWRGPVTPFITAALAERDRRAASADVSPWPKWRPQPDMPPRPSYGDWADGR